MRSGLHILLLSSFTLVACDRLFTDETAQKALEAKVVDTKVLDAKAIGYACRVSQKAPENCMKENDTQSPSNILTGWKDADKEIHDKVIDPTMGITRPAPTPAAAVSAAVPSPASTTQKHGISKKAK